MEDPICIKTMRTAAYLRKISTVFVAPQIRKTQKTYPAVAASVSNGRATVTTLKRPENTTRHPEIICSLVVSSLKAFSSQSGPISIPNPTVVIINVTSASILESLWYLVVFDSYHLL